MIVLLEFDEPLTVRVIGAGEQPDDQQTVRAVHAAPSDPDTPRDPGPVTACGLDTSGMTIEPWQPPGPGSRWFPPRWSRLICPRCDATVRST